MDYINKRLKELSKLKKGWLDTEPNSEPPSTALLNFILVNWARHGEHIPEPRIYPTPEGGVCFEWDSSSEVYYATLEFATDFSAVLYIPDIFDYGIEYRFSDSENVFKEMCDTIREQLR